MAADSLSSTQSPSSDHAPPPSPPPPAPPPAPATATTKEASKSGDRPECFANTTAEILFVIATTLSVAMTSILTGGLSVVTNEVGRDLHMNNAEITWIQASSSLAAGSFLLFFGRVADLTSRRWQFIVAQALFAVFCLGLGFAKTGLAFDVLCGITGVLSAAAVPPAIGGLGAVYPKPSKRKNYAFACFSAGNPLGFVFGSFVCGVFAQFVSWRAYLWFMAGLYVVFAAISYFVTPPDDSDKKPLTWETLKTFDLVGTILTISGFGLLSASLTLAGDAPQGWRTPYVIATLVVGVVLIVAFLFWETKASDPLLPMWVWKDRDFSFLLLLLFLGFGAFSSASFWISLYIQRFRTSSPLLVAVYQLPMAVMGTFVNVVAGLVLHKVSNKLLMYIGTTCYVVSFLLLGFNKDGFSYWDLIFPSFLLNVWGADLQFNVANMYVMTSLPPHQQSTGGGIFQTTSRLASTIIIGISTAIYNAIDQNPPTSGYFAGQNTAPYSGIFFFAAGITGLSLFLVPFLRVNTQGGAERSNSEVATRIEVGLASEKPVAAVAIGGDEQKKSDTAV